MAKIPLYQTAVKASSTPVQRGSMSDASRVWGAIGDFGESVAYAGKVIGQAQENKSRDEIRAMRLQEENDRRRQSLADKLQKEKDSVDEKRLNNRLNNNWNAANDTMSQMVDQRATEEEINEFYETYAGQQLEILENAEVSDKVRERARTTLIDIAQRSDHAVNGADGYQFKRQINAIDYALIEEENSAMDSGDEARYNEAIWGRRTLGTITDEEYSKRKSVFGKKAYYRRQYGMLDNDYTGAIANTDTTKMTDEDAKMWSEHRFEVKNRIDTEEQKIHDRTFDESLAEVGRGGMTLSEIEALASNEVPVYAGVKTVPLTEERRVALKNAVTGQVSEDKDLISYIQANRLMADKLETGNIAGGDMDEVLRRMRKQSGEPKFTTQTNFEMMDRVRNMFRAGRYYDPEGRKGAFRLSQVHAKGVRKVIDLYEEQINILDIDDNQEFKNVQGRLQSLFDMYELHGEKLTDTQLEEWWAKEMKEDSMANAVERQRRKALGDANPKQEWGIDEYDMFIKAYKEKK